MTVSKLGHRYRQGVRWVDDIIDITISGIQIIFFVLVAGVMMHLHPIAAIFSFIPLSFAWGEHFIFSYKKMSRIPRWFDDFLTKAMEKAIPMGFLFAVAALLTGSKILGGTSAMFLAIMAGSFVYAMWHDMVIYPKYGP